MYIKIIFLCFIFKLIFGDNIAQRLLNRYNDVRNECIDWRNNKKPAYECTGLMARGLNNYVGDVKQRYAWSKKDSNKRKNAFSATFLRRDQLFKRFPHGYESGFIYYPHLKTPRRKNKYSVLCAFPIDGWTDYRYGKHGCGKWKNDRSGKSEHCDLQGITTIKRWINHYKDVTKDKDKDFSKWQCGFDTTTKDGARNFAVALEAKRYLGKNSQKYGWRHTELQIRGWNGSRPEKMPIEAFFYLIGYSSGQQKAFMYQQDYLALTGERVPVVGIQLPQPNYPKFIVKFP